MKIEEFALERIQSLYENTVELNLSDSGVHPMSLNELLSEQEMSELRSLELGYGWTNGAVSLQKDNRGSVQRPRSRRCHRHQWFFGSELPDGDVIAGSG